MNGGYDALISIIPQAAISTVIIGLCTFVYKTIKFLVERSYQEMIDNNEQVRKKLDEMNEKFSMVERDTYEIKMQLNSFVTVEKHYATTRSVTQDITEMREKVARIEGRVHP